MKEENKEIQKYNSEDIEKLKAAIIEVGETIIEAVKPAIEVVKDMYNTIIETCKTDPEVKKCYGIYKRTKNGRIRKKQMSRINKIITRRNIKNGNMDKNAE